MEVDKSIEATIMDYIRFFPEEIQNDYEVMLQRCNFHDATDPCFPIMLFLLFFQESICEKMEQLDLSVRETRDEIQKKQIIAASGTQQNHKWFKFIMILLAVVNLTGSVGWIAYSVFANRVPNTAQIREKKEQDQLRELNRYWIAKLEEDEYSIAAARRWDWINTIAVGLSVSAVLTLLFCALVMRKIGNRERPASEPGRIFNTGRKKKILQLFSRIASNDQKENQDMKQKALIQPEIKKTEHKKK